jgi:hypothetical protein
MTELSKLHRRLAALRRKRTATRWTGALSALVCAMAWVLLLILAVDLVFELDLAQRLLVFGLGVVAVGWALRRYVWPLLAIRETEIQLALMVENRHGIASDLVAAIQFERPEAAGWGSSQLEHAVIERTATLSRRLDVSRGLAQPQTGRRVVLAAVTLGVVGGLVSFFPGHARVFVRRLALAGDHYPSATVIDTVELNSRPVLDRRGGATTPSDVTCAEGRPLTFAVHCSGRLPAAGTVRITSDGGRQRTVDLTSAGTPGAYTGQLPRLVEPFSWQLYVGDAWTDPARVEMLPLPIVELQLTPTLPAYSQTAGAEPAADAARQIAVLEGSEVDVAIRCTNGKRLRRAWLTVTGGETPVQHELVADERAARRWRLPVGTAPFAQVAEEVRFDLQVIDQDQMSLETPIHGHIRIRQDRPPVCSADVVHRVVLPTATPVVEYRVNDDFGLAGLTLHVDVQRLADTADRPTGVQCTLDVLPGGLPLVAGDLPLEGQFPLELAALSPENAAAEQPLQLAKGDRLRVTLEAVDYRGSLPGQAFRSDPLVLEISDESGVLTAISEADERSEQRLTDIIQQQLGIADQ